jgi:hypothetical protein
MFLAIAGRCDFWEKQLTKLAINEKMLTSSATSSSHGMGVVSEEDTDEESVPRAIDEV